MPNNVQWRLRRPGPNDSKLRMGTFKFSPAFLLALKAYSAAESERTGKRVSQGVILEGLALKGSTELRQLAKTAAAKSQ